LRFRRNDEPTHHSWGGAPLNGAQAEEDSARGTGQAPKEGLEEESS